jgi:hypothetical protein
MSKKKDSAEKAIRDIRRATRRATHASQANAAVTPPGEA